MSTVLNSTLAVIMIICTIPVSIGVALLVKLKSSGPVFYKGVRLGLNKTPFVMYKFRTLPVTAQKIIGAKLLSDKHSMITPFAKFLRDTRIDEIPQLFNVLKGNMDFVGPRPVRPEIYETLCAQIGDYDLRFCRKPGLVGYSQLFTPHSTPKRIRSLIDNRFIKKKRSHTQDLCLLCYTALVIIQLVVNKGLAFIWKYFIATRILHRYAHKRSLSLNRTNLKDVKVYITSHTAEKQIAVIEGNVLDIDEKAFRMSTKQRIGADQHIFILEKMCRKHFRKVKIRCKCTGKLCRDYHKKDSDDGISYEIIKYTPMSQLDFFRFEKYLLKKSMA